DGITYWPFAEILKQHAEVQDSDPTETVRRKIDASCRAVLASDPTIDPLRAVGALAYTAGVELPEAPMSDEPRQIRAEIHLAWRSFFTALSRRGPVVAVIEDIHWADEALLDLLDELGDRVAGGVMFVCPARPELLERRAGWGGGRRNFSSVALEPLSPDDADRLVRHLLTIDDLPPTVRNRILERAEGNPFFLEEIVRHLIDDGLIVREAGRWRAQARIAEVEIPDTVQAVLAARIDILPPDDKQALQRAAVVGRVFWTGPVVRLLDGDTERLDRALDRLEDRELVASRLGSSFAGETEFSFKHVLTREVAYGSLPRRDRGRAHATVARWLEDVSAERAGEFVELLAYHYGEALRGAREDPSTAADEIERLRAKTFESLLSAAEATRRRFSIAKAFRLAEQARGLAATPLERARVLEQIGVAAISDYRGDLAWETLKEAVEIRLLHAPDDRQALARVCGRAVESPTRWPGSMRTTVTEEEIERLIAIGLEHLAPDRDGEDRVRLLIARAFGPFSVGHGRHPTEEEVALSLRAGEEAADMAVRIGRIDLASAALDATASALLIDGMYGLQIPYIERRIDLAPRINNPWEVGDIFAMAAWSYANIGHHRRALEYGEEGAFRAAEDAEGIRLHNLAWCACAAFHLGDWDRIVDDLFPKVDAILRDRDEPPYFVSHLYGTAQFILTAREDPRASEQVELLEEMATDHPRASVLVGWLAWIRARSGDAARAMELLSTVDAIPSSVFRPHTDLMRAGVYSDLASFDAVPAFLETTRAYAAKAGLVALPAALDALEGRMAFAADDVATGTAALRRARERFVELSMPFERARAELSLAEGLAASDPAEARGLLDPATREAERLGSTWELRRASEVRPRLG
ncbi:MAG TPA: hypothetical protein VEC15_02525, partial [Actinomycetota bacterium]|nr:hypothetical protein [Actinomycetota bacterium]